MKVNASVPDPGQSHTHWSSQLKKRRHAANKRYKYSHFTLTSCQESTRTTSINTSKHESKMLYTTTLLASLVSFSTAQTLNIPTRSGSIVSLASPSTISGSVDYGNKEFDRGRDCNTDDDTGSDSAVFILNDGASISNVIIGSRQLEGIHCKGACTLKNVWFRDVCEGKQSSSPLQLT
jgi:hypothetical protein